MWTVIVFVTASLLQCAAGQVSPANTTSFCLDTRGTFCVQAAPTADPAVYRVSLQSSYTGWVGVGFGSSRMSGNAPTYIAWNNGNSVVVSLRRTSSKNTPTFLNAVTAQKDASSASGGISASFDVPAATLGLGKGSLNCMYGMSNRGPSTASSASSNFPEHSKYGSFVLNFGGQTGGSTSNNAITTAAGPGQSISSYCFDSQNSFCAVALRDTSTNVITFTLYSSAAGWISIGTGSSMSGSTMFVGWKNGANVLVSQWKGSGHNVSPTTSGTVLTTVANPAIVTIPSTAAIAFSFTVPVSSNLISTTSSSNFIFGILKLELIK
ncbi:hypothetical protein BDR26DRAFT_915582 [Obelidium mucronatum]|nr:hypothetical protein BDR26DRAFT_915582 [Obelidium mucronatum]